MTTYINTSLTVLHEFRSIGIVNFGLVIFRLFFGWMDMVTTVTVC